MSSIIYGLDYSAGELTPAQVAAAAPAYDVRFLMRYIGWPDNPKCISHYPGAYSRHVAAGRTVLLIAEDGTADAAGGFPGGAAMARRALADARTVGYPEHLPIFFCADGWLADHNISIATAMSYLDGAASVIGLQRVGAYGFRDFVRAARDHNKAPTRWLCGSPPSVDDIASGLCHYYQWNGGSINVAGIDCDVNWSYVAAPRPPDPDHDHDTAASTSTGAKIMRYVNLDNPDGSTPNRVAVLTIDPVSTSLVMPKDARAWVQFEAFYPTAPKVVARLQWLVFVRSGLPAIPRDPRDLPHRANFAEELPDATCGVEVQVTGIPEGGCVGVHVDGMGHA